jgi:hypothetical protein
MEVVGGGFLNHQSKSTDNPRDGPAGGRATHDHVRGSILVYCENRRTHVPWSLYLLIVGRDCVWQSHSGHPTRDGG